MLYNHEELAIAELGKCLTAIELITPLKPKVAKKAKVSITPPNCESTPDNESENFLKIPSLPEAIAQVTNAPSIAPSIAVLSESSIVFLKALRVASSKKVFFRITVLGLPSKSLKAPKIT